MRVITIDQIVRSAIVEKNRSVHWYWPYLKLATDCLSQLHVHTLKSSRTVKVAVSDTGEVVLPCDAIDVVGMWNHDRKSSEEDGRIRIQRTDPSVLYIIPGHCWIKDTAYLEFITDGKCDAASKVNYLALRTILTYIFWKSSPNAANASSPEGRDYHNQLRILRANRFGTTVEIIRQALNKQTHWDPTRYSGDPLNRTY